MKLGIISNFVSKLILTIPPEYREPLQKILIENVIKGLSHKDIHVQKSSAEMIASCNKEAMPALKNTVEQQIEKGLINTN